ncbi:MAG: hypothetical protein Q8Q14_13005 [Gemmatimonadales bacterium]|nr:hypothetical protein [Gemmatimonadales bacterium]
MTTRPLPPGVSDLVLRGMRSIEVLVFGVPAVPTKRRPGVAVLTAGLEYFGYLVDLMEQFRAAGPWDAALLPERCEEAARVVEEVGQVALEALREEIAEDNPRLTPAQVATLARLILGEPVPPASDAPPEAAT